MCDEIWRADQSAEQVGGRFERTVDSIYFGGGTPTLLDVAQLERIFVNVRQNFELRPDVEITVECAPGTLSEDVIAALVRCGVNRVSLGVQSFVDREAASVGRLHKRDVVLDDIARLRNAGISNINVDLIAGLPHQTRESWEYSLDELIASGVPHASVYMLEVDEDSRLGRELMAGGQKYHAHFVPDDDLTADMYEVACDRLNAAGIQQYEISNFARGGFESKHNLKYWTRQPYLGFGVDAHSMLASTNVNGAVRFSNPDALEKYVAGNPPTVSVSTTKATSGLLIRFPLTGEAKAERLVSRSRNSTRRATCCACSPCTVPGSRSTTSPSPPSTAESCSSTSSRIPRFDQNHRAIYKHTNSFSVLDCRALCPSGV